jgi:hypothetical protein
MRKGKINIIKINILNKKLKKMKDILQDECGPNKNVYLDLKKKMLLKKNYSLFKKCINTSYIYLLEHIVKVSLSRTTQEFS